MKHFALSAIAVIALLLVGCSKSTSSPATKPSVASSGKKITVCLLPKTKGNPYFETCAKGAQAAADELGNVDLIYDGPTDGSAEKQASMIETWTLQGVDVIAVSPNDPDIVAPAMKKARDKGVHVITWDSDGADGTREFFVNQATAKDIGSALVDTLAKDIAAASKISDPKQAAGQVAIITATLTAANQNAWIKYITERLPAYPKLQLIATKPCDDKQNVAFQVAQDLTKAYPDLKGIFAISSVAFPGAADAIKQSGKSGQIQITGLGTPDGMRSFVQDGTVKSVVLWNTVDLGYLTVEVARAVCDGTLKPGATTFNAGKLGAKKVEGDNVLLGNIMVFNKDNIDQFHF